jgi:hypothetical protein
VVAKLEALCNSAALVQDLVLGDVDGPSSLAASLSMVVELLKGWIDTVAAMESVGGPDLRWLLPCHIF